MNMRMLSLSVIVLIAGLFALTAGNSQAQWPGTGTLVAVPAASPPILDGQADDIIWTQATPLIVRAMSMGMGGGHHQYTDVTLKAAYTPTDLYILAKWTDPTLSIDKKTWTYDGSQWTQSGDEDRLAILWDLDNSIAGFSQMGCGAVCHGGEGRMRTDGPTEFADVWHWKAARSNPMRAVDDKYLNDDYDPADVEAAHHGDGGDSTYVPNAAAGLPRWVWNSANPSTPLGVAAEWATHFLLLDEMTDFGTLNPLTGSAWTAGDQVPGYALRPPTGSRGDIEAHGAWAAGVWTVEMRRPLDTGDHAARDGERVDQVFVPGGRYQFGVAVWDNAGGIEHRRAPGPFTLVFDEAAPGTPRPTMTPMPTGTHGPMPSMTPMMTMTPVATGTHGPMPTMTPMMTTTPGPPPGTGDNLPPVGSILINGGAETTTSPIVTLTLSATDDPGGTGVAWMYIREWGWDHTNGWHEMHRGGGHHGGGHGGGMGHMMGGWQPFAPIVAWELSPEPGVKYISVWFADAAWNVSPPATAMINLVPDGATVNGGQVHQYRHHLDAGQPMTITVHPRAGDPDLYVWTPDNAGPPDWWSNAFASDDQVTFLAPEAGVYLIEVRGYSDAVYDLDLTPESGLGITVVSLSQDKPLPPAPLVADAPDTTAAPRPGFQLYLPAVLLRP